MVLKNEIGWEIKVVEQRIAEEKISLEGAKAINCYELMSHIEGVINGLEYALIKLNYIKDIYDLTDK